MKPTPYLFFILTLLSLCIQPAHGTLYDVMGMRVLSVEQNEDDEEAPFDIRALNKRHKCGGEISNLFRVYSEFSIVSDRKFDMAMSAMLNKLSLSVSTDGCEGKALMIERMQISR